LNFSESASTDEVKAEYMDAPTPEIDQVIQKLRIIYTVILAAPLRHWLSFSVFNEDKGTKQLSTDTRLPE
jgi:hypothetical protein